jgi:hypothetical protein
VAIPQPQPEDWIRANAQALRVTDRQILAMLRDAYKEVNKELAELIAKDATGLGSGVRRSQLEASRARLLARQADIFTKLGDITSANRLRAAIRAQQLSASANAALLDLVGRQDIADFLLRAAGQTSDSAIETALARMGLSQLPLSQRIYRTQLWMDGRLGKLINATLAAGIDAKSFAKKARDWFNPNTPGGVRYAALRLARTEINNAFHAMTAQKAQSTPWIPNCKWHLSGSHPKPDICNVIASRDTGSGAGVYRSEAVPVRPHPQCMCFITPEPIAEDDFVDNFVNGDYDDYLDREIENAPIVDIGESRPAPIRAATVQDPTPLTPKNIKQGMQIQDAAGNWRTIDEISKAPGGGSRTGGGRGGQWSFRDANGDKIRGASPNELIPTKPVGSAPARPSSMISPVRRAYDSGIKSEKALGGGMMAKTYLMQTNDGLELIRKVAPNLRFETFGKPRRQADAEELGSKLLRALGVDAPEVIRTGDPGEIVMDYRSGAEVGGRYQYRDDAEQSIKDSDDAWIIALFDVATMNQDRNLGNWLVKDGRFIPIDHANMWGAESPNQTLRPSPDYHLRDVVYQQSPFWRLLHNKSDGGWKKSDISPADILRFKKILESLRPEFVRLDHLDWYEITLKRLDAFTPFAAGTKARIK